MKLPIRLENAIVKLYNAFHKGELDAMNACGCAVGNLCDNSDVWRQRGVIFGEENRITDFDNKTGYSKKELAAIELIFIYGISNFRETKKFQNCISFYDVRDKQKLKPLQRELQFKGLCAVIEYLCELDNIPNVMDIQSLFEYENDAPKKKLTEVLS